MNPDTVSHKRFPVYLTYISWESCRAWRRRRSHMKHGLASSITGTSEERGGSTAETLDRRGSETAFARHVRNRVLTVGVTGVGPITET